MYKSNYLNIAIHFRLGIYLKRSETDNNKKIIERRSDERPTMEECFAILKTISDSKAIDKEFVVVHFFAELGY